MADGKATLPDAGYAAMMTAIYKVAHYPGSMPITPASPYHPRSARAALLLVAAALAGCAHAPRTPAPVTSSGPTAPVARASDPIAASSVAIRALGLVGTPYRYGGNTPDTGFDCSGLVTYVFRDMLDLRLPRTSRELAAIQGPRIPADRLSSGDLVFFGTNGNVWHVGIYVGEGRFVHAPSTGGAVRLNHLDEPYWRQHYTGAKRVLL